MNQKLLMVAASIAALCSQGLRGQEIVGITQSSPTVVRQQFLSPQCAYKRCVPQSFEKQVAKHAGGTAYDSRVRGVWITNGLMLANVDPWKGNCDYICKPQKMPLPPVVGVKQWATGLAYVDSGAILPGNQVGPGWLFASYNNGYIARMEVKGCNVAAKFCKFPVPTGGTIAGLASDDVNRRLFVGVVLASGANIVYTTDLDKDWCKPLCKAQPGACNATTKLGPLTGLAFDPCRQALYVTDGLLTTRYVVAKEPNCDLKPAGCCKRGGDPFTGLCYLPMRNIKSVGKSCTKKACDNCLNMRAELAGDPVLGNPFFGLGLRNAPNKTSLAVLAAGIGGCSPTGVNIGFCENIRVALPPVLVFFPQTPITTPGCNRNVTLGWKVPLKQNLCGLKVSFQWLVVCKGIPTGHGVTNCVEFTFGA